MIPLPEHDNISELGPYERVLVGKLSAIIRLGDAMDKSHMQKLRKTSTEFKDNILTINASVTREATLEDWAFSQKADFFTEVFGIQTKLLIERSM
jgi:exopolyphosphatase/guanosine-5'-triphosphate,3'-diphosphate pyrophosphatase